MPTAPEKLQQALLLLLDEQEFSQLSISKICQTAGVHRSTFYSYYDHQLDLLQATQAYLVTLFEQEFTSYQAQFQAPKEYDSLLDSHYLLPYLHFIREHKKLYRIYLKHPLDFEHQKRDKSHIQKIFTHRYRKKGITDDKQIRYMSAFYLAGLRQIIYQWVQDDCKDDIPYLIQIIHTLIF